MPGALITYGTTTAASLSTANKVVTTTGGAETSTSTQFGGISGYSELFAQGTTNTWLGAGSIGSPSGNGFLYDSTALEGGVIVNGTWTPIVSLALTGSPGSNIVLDLYVRAYRRTSGGVYNLIGTMSAASNTLNKNGSKLTVTFGGTTLSLASFGTGDKLYYDCWANVTTPGLLNAFCSITLYLSSSSTQGVANDFQVTTPGTGTQVTHDLSARANVYRSATHDLSARANVTKTGIHDLTARANVTLPRSQSWASQWSFKTQMVMVYTAAGTFIDTWYDAPLLAGFKEAINAATEQLEVPLPRAFAQPNPAGRPATIAYGNIVKYYLFGPGLSANGLLRYTGVIEGWKAEIAESDGAETILVTLTPPAAVTADQAVTTTTSYSSQDPVTIFNNLFATLNSITNTNYFSPLSASGSNPGSSGNSVSLTFQVQQLFQILKTLILTLPLNWFYRTNPDSTVTLNVTPTSAQHIFTVGKDTTNPQYAIDWSQIKNVVQVKGATTLQTGTTTSTSTTTPPTAATSVTTTISNKGTSSETASSPASTTVHNDSVLASSSTSTVSSTLIAVTKSSTDVATYGEHFLPYFDPRITTTATANAVAQGLINQYDQTPPRVQIRVIDYRGDMQSGLGYDIETIAVGDSCQIIDLDPAYAGGISSVVTTIVALTYGFDYVDLELGTPAPSQSGQVAGTQATLNQQTMTASSLGQ